MRGSTVHFLDALTYKGYDEVAGGQVVLHLFHSYKCMLEVLKVLLRHCSPTPALLPIKGACAYTTFNYLSHLEWNMRTP